MSCRAPGSAWMAVTAVRTGSVAGCRDHSATLNCDWPPGRRRKSTSCRATACATCRPRSSSTRASARSMPAVTPAEVHTRPSRRKIGSQSTRTSGCSRASCSSRAQCVVTRRPSSRPAAASRNTPLHTEATRRAPAAAAATQETSAASSRARSTPSPPTTTRVSVPAGSRSATPCPACTNSPLTDRTGPARVATTSQAYPPAPWNTSCGPVRSSGWKPSKTTKTTRCSVTPPRSTGPDHGVNDARPTDRAMGRPPRRGYHGTRGRGGSR